MLGADALSMPGRRRWPWGDESRDGKEGAPGLCAKEGCSVGRSSGLCAGGRGELGLGYCLGSHGEVLRRPWRRKGCGGLQGLGKVMGPSLRLR